MNTSQGALYFGAGIDLNQWRRDVDSMRRDIVGLTRDVEKETRNVDSAFKNLSIGIAGYLSVNALKGFAMELINVRGEFQKTEIAFSTMLGSADKAKVLMGQMVDLAAKTPFGLEEVSAGAKQLLAFQIPANQVVDVLTRMGNIAAGLGVPLSRINLVYGQVKAKGKLMGDDLRQFTEAGIPMVAELAKKFNKTTGEIQEMVSAGKIGFKDVQDVLFAMTNEGGMFFNLMEKQSASLSGKVANLGDSWDQMLNKIGAANEGILYDGIEGLTHLIEHYEEMFEIIKTLVVAYGSYRAALIVTASAQAFSNKTLATEIGLLSVSQRWKLGRALVTQRQTAATVLEAQAERASLATKYATLQAEVSSLAVKKQKAVALGIERAQIVGNARVQLALAQAELRSLQANGTAREILIATRNVEKAQNTVLATQESAAIARKAALTAGTQFHTAQKELEATATALTTASKVAETAAETANIAAKNANTLATARLTLAQHAQTIAMGAAARAASFLNATLFANPYALATALIAALAYAVYKYSSALTQAEESQKRMNDDLKNQIPAITEQESKLKSLVKVIGDHKTSEDLRASSLKQVQTITNGRLTQLDEEAVRTGKATNMIKQYIEMLKLEAEAKRYVNELGRLDSDVEDLKNNRGNFGLGDMWDDFTDFDSKFNWNLKERKKERVDRIVKDKEAEKIEIQKKLDALAAKGVNISDMPVNETTTPSGKKGWAQTIKDQIDALEAEANSAPTRAAYLRIQAKIKSLNDLLSTKEKTDNKQLAELLPMGSIKELQRRANLIQEAIDTAVNGQVKLRKLDKYGKDTDKKGNPYLTGEVVSTEEAGKRLEDLNNLIKQNQYRNFQERIDDAERQWNNYYRMAEFYGKESADAQYKELFKGAANYLQYLENQEQALKDLSEKQVLTPQQKQDLVYLGDKIRSLNGTVTPFENFKKGIDDSLKVIPSLVDQLEFVEKANEDAFQKAGGNTDLFLQQKKYFEERKKELLQQQKDIQSEFLKEHETFETKRIEIEKRFNSIREQIGQNKTYSDSERLRLLDSAGKDEAKAYRDAFTSIFEKSDLFDKAFSNINALTKKEIDNLIPQLEAKFQELSNLGTPNAELEDFRKKIESLKALSTGNNPIKALINSFKELRKRIREGTATQEDFSRLNEQLQRTKFYTDLAINSAKELAEAMGIDGKGGAFEKFAKDLTQTLEGLINALVGYFSGNLQQMVGGIAQMVVGIIKMLSTAGDGRKEKQIREWKIAVDQLKTAYEELERVIEKTAGESQLKMQRDLIANLKEQQRILQQMRSKEADKKKVDQDKIASYTQQIQDINLQIQEIIDNFQTSITTTDFKELSQKIADALIDAFGKGEDAAASFEKVVDDVMRNAVANALRIKILEPAVKSMVDQLYNSLGFGGQSGATTDQAAKMQEYQQAIAEINEKLKTANSLTAYGLNNLKNDYLEKIKILQQQIAANAASGSFDGLTEAEREAIKALGVDAMNQYTAALQQYQDLFGSASENAQGLKGDIKGITEKTAGALEAQFNALRINVVAVLQLMKQNHTVNNAQTALLSQIEINTRRLHNIDKNIAELNAKVKKNLAGVP